MNVVDRLVELTEQVMLGEHAALRRIVEASGGTWITDEDGRNPRCDIHGMVVGIPINCDPIGSYVQVCFAIIGPNWILVPECTAGMRTITDRWAARTKRAKAMAS